MRRFSRSFSAAISCAVARSARDWASRVSVIVAVPTSKLRLAEAASHRPRQIAVQTS